MCLPDTNLPEADRAEKRASFSLGVSGDTAKEELEGMTVNFPKRWHQPSLSVHPAYLHAAMIIDPKHSHQLLYL